MAGTIIDQLIVTLGLDSKGFTKGNAEARKTLSDTQENVKKSAEAMVASLKSVALEFVGLFVAVRSVQDIVSFFVDLNASTRQLGIDAKNFGVSAAELRNWQNVATLAGGSAEDATKTIGSLQQSIFNMKFKGEVSDQLQYLMRLGVQFQTATGAAAPFRDVIFGVAKAMDASRLSQADKTNYLQAMGFDKGLVNALSGGTKGLQHYYDAALRVQQETPQQVEAAARMAEAWDQLKINVIASAQQLLVAAEPAITRLFALLDEGISWLNKPENSQAVIDWFTGLGAWVGGPGGDKVLSFFRDFASLVQTLAGALKDVGDSSLLGFFQKQLTTDPVTQLYHALTEAPRAEQTKPAAAPLGSQVPGPKGYATEAPPAAAPLGSQVPGPKGYATEAPPEDHSVIGWLQDKARAAVGQQTQVEATTAANRARYTPLLAQAEQKYSIPEGVLQRIAQTESGFSSDVISGQRKSSAGAVGIMQFMPATNPNAGKDPAADIDAGGKYLRKLYEQFGNWDLAVMAYNDGPGNIAKALKAHGGDVQALLHDRTATNAETRNYRTQVMGGNDKAKGSSLVMGGNDNALNAAQGTQSSPGVRAQAATAQAAPNTASNSTNVDIGQITIMSQATDAQGLARDLHAAVERRFTVAQADSGVLA